MDAFCAGTRFLTEHKKLSVHHISQREFDHGKSRNLGAKKSEADIFIFMTQDAVPANEYLLEKLIAPLNDETVACSYARQLPAEDATMTEQLTRVYNYPAVGRIKSKEDLKRDWGMTYSKYPEIANIEVIGQFFFMCGYLYSKQFNKVVIADSHKEISHILVFFPFCLFKNNFFS